MCYSMYACQGIFLPPQPPPLGLSMHSLYQTDIKMLWLGGTINLFWKHAILLSPRDPDIFYWLLTIHSSVINTTGRTCGRFLTCHDHCKEIMCLTMAILLMYPLCTTSKWGKFTFIAPGFNFNLIVFACLASLCKHQFINKILVSAK